MSWMTWVCEKLHWKTSHSVRASSTRIVSVEQQWLSPTEAFRLIRVSIDGDLHCFAALTTKQSAQLIEVPRSIHAASAKQESLA
jgi:hypothetical protein